MNILKLHFVCFILLAELSCNDYYTGNPYLEYDHSRNLQASNFKMIRIRMDETTLNKQANNGINLEYIETIKNYLKKAIQRVEMLIRVLPNTSNQFIQYCHTKVEIDPTISGIGVQADLIIFPFINISKDPTGSNQSLMYGKYCYYDQESGKPTAGYIALRDDYNYTKERAEEFYVTQMIHTLIHILGFDEDLFDGFVEKGTITKIGKAKVYSDDLTDTFNQMLIIHKDVLNTAKAYFNCNSIRGIPLITKKYNSADGAIQTHWNARFMLGDIMINSVYSEQTLSEITLALLEATGWYEINYFTGGLFRFGKGRGCNFIDFKCVKNSYTDFSNEFCLNAGVGMCSAGRLSRGFCYLDFKLQTKIKSYQQLFNSPTSGGLSFVDYCPVSAARVETDETFYYDSCTLGQAENFSIFGEVISPNSGCFLTNLFLKNNPGVQTYSNKLTTICYQYYCDPKTKTYKIQNRENLYNCKSEGDQIQTDQTEGTLICPNYSHVCTSSVVCSSLIDCIDKLSLNILVVEDQTKNQPVQSIMGTPADLMVKESTMKIFEPRAENLKFDTGLVTVVSSSHLFTSSILIALVLVFYSI